MIPERDTVTEIIRDVTEAEILPRFQNLGKADVATKANPHDLVTTADLESEKRLTEALSTLIPNSRVVGEEGTEKNPETLDALAGPLPVWVVDPVDGTLNFARGKPRFCVIVALVRAGRTLAGWIHDPIANETAWAARGEGAWIGDERLHVAKPVPFRKMTGSLGFHLAKRMKEAELRGEGETPARVVRSGCTGLDYVDLARGGLDFAHYGRRLKPWDHAAGVLLHKEAGGFSAITRNRDSYSPGGGIQDGVSLLMAPNAARWLEVKEGLGL